jgi:hypothetical protein
VHLLVPYTHPPLSEILCAQYKTRATDTQLEQRDLRQPIASVDSLTGVVVIIVVLLAVQLI